MDELENVEFLKKLAREAEKLGSPHLCPNEFWASAYKQIARGAGLLWRLLEQSGNNEKPAHRD
jgi:hypothetical protein